MQFPIFAQRKLNREFYLWYAKTFHNLPVERASQTFVYQSQVFRFACRDLILTIKDFLKSAF